MKVDVDHSLDQLAVDKLLKDRMNISGTSVLISYLFYSEGQI